MSTIRIWLEIPTAVLLLAAAGTGAAAQAAAPASREPRAAIRCEGAIQHPLQVTATLLDPLRRGENVRVRVAATAARDLDRAEVRMVHSGGASPASPTRAAIGRLAAGRTAVHEFSVRIPAEGHRFLLQFRVTGEGRNGLESRGATLNLLPDGPADAGRVVNAGGSPVVEYRARRIDR